MIGRGDKRIGISLICPSAEPSTGTFATLALGKICYVEILCDKIHLQSFEGHIESLGKPTNRVTGDHSTDGSCQIAYRVKLWLIAPIRIWIFTTANRLFGG